MTTQVEDQDQAVVIINRKRLLEFTTLVAILHPSWLITPRLATHEKVLVDEGKKWPKNTFNLRNVVGVPFFQRVIL